MRKVTIIDNSTVSVQEIPGLIFNRQASASRLIGGVNV